MEHVQAFGWKGEGMSEDRINMRGMKAAEDIISQQQKRIKEYESEIKNLQAQCLANEDAGRAAMSGFIKAKSEAEQFRSALATQCSQTLAAAKQERTRIAGIIQQMIDARRARAGMDIGVESIQARTEIGVLQILLGAIG